MFIYFQMKTWVFMALYYWSFPLLLLHTPFSFRLQSLGTLIVYTFFSEWGVVVKKFLWQLPKHVTLTVTFKKGNAPWSFDRVNSIFCPENGDTVKGEIIYKNVYIFYYFLLYFDTQRCLFKNSVLSTHIAKINDHFFHV